MAWTSADGLVKKEGSTWSRLRRGAWEAMPGAETPKGYEAERAAYLEARREQVALEVSKTAPKPGDDVIAARAEKAADWKTFALASVVPGTDPRAFVYSKDGALYRGNFKAFMLVLRDRFDAAGETPLLTWMTRVESVLADEARVRPETHRATPGSVTSGVGSRNARRVADERRIA